MTLMGEKGEDLGGRGSAGAQEKCLKGLLSGITVAAGQELMARTRRKLLRAN